jgi:hypothetical protein
MSVVLRHPHLGREDPKYGGYKTNFLMPIPESQEIRDLIKAEMVRVLGASAKDAKKPYWASKEEEGMVEFRTRSKFAVKVYDIQGRLLPQSAIPMLSTGTVGKVTFEIVARNGDKPSCALYLKSVQILKAEVYSPFRDESDSIKGEGFVYSGPNQDQEPDEFGDDLDGASTGPSEDIDLDDGLGDSDLENKTAEPDIEDDFGGGGLGEDDF